MSPDLLGQMWARRSSGGCSVDLGTRRSLRAVDPIPCHTLENPNEFTSTDGIDTMLFSMYTEFASYGLLYCLDLI